MCARCPRASDPIRARPHVGGAPGGHPGRRSCERRDPTASVGSGAPADRVLRRGPVETAVFVPIAETLHQGEGPGTHLGPPGFRRDEALDVGARYLAASFRHRCHHGGLDRGVACWSLHLISSDFPRRRSTNPVGVEGLYGVVRSDVPGGRCVSLVGGVGGGDLGGRDLPDREVAEGVAGLPGGEALRLVTSEPVKKSRIGANMIVKC